MRISHRRPSAPYGLAWIVQPIIFVYLYLIPRTARGLKGSAEFYPLFILHASFLEKPSFTHLAIESQFATMFSSDPCCHLSNNSGGPPLNRLSSLPSIFVLAPKEYFSSPAHMAALYKMMDWATHIRILNVQLLGQSSSLGIWERWLPQYYGHIFLS